MRRPIHQHRGRVLVSLTAAAGLCLGLAAVSTGPATSAEPSGDCAVAYPVDELTAGDAVTGLTVTRGVSPTAFTGEVLGVLDDGIGPDLDMVMVELSSPEVDEIGIWQGMSGSPVYASDGRLIGAVAYSLAMGSTPVAGVTPFADMDEYVAPAGTVEVNPVAARAIARDTDVTVAQAERGFTQLPTPIGVAGVGARQLTTAAEKAGRRTYLPTSAYVVGRTATAAGPESIVAGSNLAASLSYGDVTMAAVGTTTSVCGGRVVGFGHPVAHLGRTTLALHPADALYIQDDLISGFKVANLGEPVGTITQDRGTGISGVLGPLPSTATVTARVSTEERSRTGVTHAALRTPDALASVTFYGLIGNHERVVDGPMVGNEELTWTVTGTDRNGAPFELSAADRYTSRYDLTWEVGFGIGDLVYALAGIPGISIDSISTTADLHPDTATYRLATLELKRAGRWVEVDRRHPGVVRPGHRLVARATLTGKGGPITLPMSFRAPSKAPRGMAFLQVRGGDGLFGSRPPRSVAGAKAWVDDLVRRDEVQASFTTRPRGSGMSEYFFMFGRSARRGFNHTTVAGRMDRVVKGSLLAPVVIRRP